MSEPTLSQLLVDLEMKVAHQDLVIETLNQTVIRQAQEIESLQTKFEAIIRRLRDLGSADAQIRPGHEKPPHY